MITLYMSTVRSMVSIFLFISDQFPSPSSCDLSPVRVVVNPVSNRLLVGLAGSRRRGVFGVSCRIMLSVAPTM